jgi:queuine tRNA-ribosyltransferase
MARRGTLLFPGFQAETPLFMPVGTQATVKGMTPADLQRIGFPIILSNTYHLYLRPGTEVIAALEGLHRFMGWKNAILTDSGGFQVFSLRERSTITDEGVEFRSHIDGSKHFFSPEGVVKMQQVFGSDIMMPLDECVSPDATMSYVRESLKRTHLWAERSMKTLETDQVLFGIIQGGIYDELRKESAKTLCDMNFPGYSIGGLSVGESKDIMYGVLENLTPLIPQDRPRYLMGVGAPEDLVEAVARGVDMFDCVLPTRMGRTGTLLTRHGRMVLKHACYKTDPAPPDPECLCSTCRNFSRAYLRHLFMADEMLGGTLATYHNLHFLHTLMAEMRHAIEEKHFDGYRKRFLSTYFSGALS